MKLDFVSTTVSDVPVNLLFLQYMLIVWINERVNKWVTGETLLRIEEVSKLKHSQEKENEISLFHLESHLLWNKILFHFCHSFFTWTVFIFNNKNDGKRLNSIGW